MEKKKWEKPVCEKVKLVPAEAILSGCKNPSDKHGGCVPAAHAAAS